MDTKEQHNHNPEETDQPVEREEKSAENNSNQDNPETNPENNSSQETPKSVEPSDEESGPADPAPVEKKNLQSDLQENTTEETAIKDIKEEKKSENAPESLEDEESDKQVSISNKEGSIVDEDQDEEDSDDEDHEDEDDTSVNYDELGIDELVETLEEIVKDDNVQAIRKKVALIKVSFLKKHKQKEEERLESQAVTDEDDEHQHEDNLQERFDKAFHVYSEKRKTFLENQEKQKLENLEAKKLILEELKTLIESEESLKKTYDEFRELQEKWKSIGMVPKSEVNNLWQNYHFYVEKFFDKVKINKELRDLDLKKNFEAKIALCEKAEELLLETSILKSFKQLQQYHREWKEIGPVPQDKKDDLWERFKRTTEKINEARREHYNKMREEQKNNLVAKTALCEKAEELLQIENNSIREWQENTEKISELLKVWKTIGPAPRAENDEIWERFKTSLDTFFAGKKEYFQKIKEEQLNNYNLKLDLCAQAEAIKNSTDWKKTTRELINLQKEWKKIGPVPRKHSDKIWKRFRAACDEFFNNKSDYFANIKQHEAENLKQKQDLIKKIWTFEFSEDKNENLETLKEFQREWTEIGHVPFKEKDKIQQDFRNAVNEKLDNLKISKAEMQTINYKQRFENIKEKPNAKKIVKNEKYFLTQKVKKLEDEIKLLENNMGFLAESKKADLLKLEFEKKIDNAKNEVEVIREKIRFLEKEAE